MSRASLSSGGKILLGILAVLALVLVIGVVGWIAYDPAADDGSTPNQSPAPAPTSSS
ncbi:hypothetical protein ACFXOR_07730 [Streptomyces sp. NPDC059164]|uniref:hypothetical protein n=1 Tax=Streptomyces sp. NPDC059164 TaxID=3346750 RepID=UPI003675E04F